MARFDNKVVLVSGGARGQGAAEAHLLVAQGANAGQSALKALLAPFPSDEMICWPVNARVGNVKNNDASLIESINAVSH
jgi:NAD(P)-dependent dehydrogenase (short-subunit alcohol dehydrogenase family)